MTARPILFSAPMVRALLDGRKTQTRRLAWRHCERDCMSRWYPKPLDPWGPLHCHKTIWQSVKPGDKLYVRETWCHTGDGVWSVGDAQMAWQGRVVYRADDDNAYTSWFPSIHMPRRFSRLTLLVTATKMERVQEISDEDAEAEGAFEMSRIGDDPMHPTWTMTGKSWRYNTPRSAFESIWRTLHTKPDTRWEDNPEVMALTFTVHQQNINAMEAA